MTSRSLSPRIDRLYNKATSLIDEAVQHSYITRCSYDPQTRTGFTYLEVPTGEEFTLYSDGDLFVRSDSYTDTHRVADIILSVSISGSDHAATVIEHRTDPSENLGMQYDTTIPTWQHEDAATLILGHMASGVVAPEAA